MFQAYRRYADFQGRSNRAEYWLFILLLLIQACVAFALDSMLFDGLRNMDEWGVSGPFYGVLLLANLIPSLSVQVRRLHDLDRTGWWVLISFAPLVGGLVLFVFDLLPGTRGSNRFGPPPGQPIEDLQETFS